jgi:tRNA threonylcarbamoyladenosine biosynthesis protein TsaE
MLHYKTTLADEAATQALGKSLAACLNPGLNIHLHGDLGAGKTALTRALLHAAGHQGHVKSPTYTLVEIYQIQIAKSSVKCLHFDLYRMNSPEEFQEAGLHEEFNAHNICIVEWPEKAQGVLPAADLHIFLQFADHGRKVELQAMSDKGSECLKQLRFAPNL